MATFRVRVNVSAGDIAAEMKTSFILGFAVSAHVERITLWPLIKRRTSPCFFAAITFVSVMASGTPITATVSGGML
jgi:hypothetical protein